MPSVCLINYLKFTAGHVRVCRCGGGLPQYLISQTCEGILGPQASLLGPGVGTCCSTIQVGLYLCMILVLYYLQIPRALMLVSTGPPAIPRWRPRCHVLLIIYIAPPLLKKMAKIQTCYCYC
jgi:hypothetical protein